MVQRCDWTLLLRKWRWNDCHRQSEHYSHTLTDFFSLLRLGEYIVSTRRCHMPHNSSEYGFIAIDTSWSCNFLSWRYQLATIRFFLWGYAEDRFYADKPLTFEHLKTNLPQVMAEIPPNMCQKVCRKLPQKNQCLQHFAWRM